MNNELTEFQAWKIKTLEAKLYDTLLSVTEKFGYNCEEYQEARKNWITAQWFVSYFANKFPDIMKTVHA